MPKPPPSLALNSVGFNAFYHYQNSVSIAIYVYSNVAITKFGLFVRQQVTRKLLNYCMISYFYKKNKTNLLIIYFFLFLLRNLS